MALDLEWRRRLAAAFDPMRVLTADECERLYVPRGDELGAVDLLYAALEEAGPQPAGFRWALVGPRGVGKSTELVELSRRLRAEGSPAVPVLVDIGDALVHGASTAAWLPAVAAAAVAARTDWSGAAPRTSPDLAEGLRAVGVAAELFTGVVELLKPAAGAVGAGAGLAVAGAAARQVSAMAHAVREQTPDRPALEALVEGLSGELRALGDAAGRPPVLLLDGLDKLAQAEEVFLALSEAELLQGMPAGLLILGPTALRLDPRFAGLQLQGFQPLTLHTLPVVDRDGRPKAEGVHVLRELFDRRWAQAELGDRARFPDAQVDEAARASSGLVREFLKVALDAGRLAALQGAGGVGPAHVAAALKQRRQAHEVLLHAEHLGPLLAALDHPDRPPASGPVHEWPLGNNLLLCHRNGTLWYRPHELLVPFLEAGRAEPARG